ncbi:SRPBCC family protein [Oscillatoria sp. CS-180]|uniref:SRPBCC family protein n=1 Tax=Oscillatoria sp. CS-180 TaxID=3021720 RepID=UPI0023305178|nr:SRPBCC family protein [Oscillatoria sp. CS-180]MDB9525759.1 SRPBCC family protein [Oscillatoria sp. CS-180]
MVSSVITSSAKRPSLLLLGKKRSHSGHEVDALHRGRVLIETQAHGMMGGAVSTKMYVKATRADLWQKLTNYSRWVEYFPNITRSEVIAKGQNAHRLYQVGRKAFLAIAAEVEVYLKVYEDAYHSIQFRLEKGTFKDFGADLTLQDWQNGTLLTYTVQATPLIPVPSFLIEQGMRQDLPGNMEHMRRMLCR